MPGSVALHPGEKALVMGLGSFGGGVGAARYLAGLGARVTVTDLRGADSLGDSLEQIRDLGLRTVLGEHRSEDFVASDLVVVNPAVRPDHPLLGAARAAGARITTEIELFLGAVRARVVCITGTQGKSTTCHMLHGLLRGSGRRTHLGGNIGGSLLGALPTIRPDDVCVLELSSYQLESLAPHRPGDGIELAAITNVLADHLERHGSPEAYLRAKARIRELVRPGGTLVYPEDLGRLGAGLAPGVRTLSHGDSPGAPIRCEAGWFHLEDERLAAAGDLAVPGGFQHENARVALALARLLDVPADDLARELPRLTGLPHRLESLGSRDGRLVIDNGVSTTPDSTVAALHSCATGTTLLCGGRGKALPWAPLVEAVRQRDARVIAFGEARGEIGRALREEGRTCAERATLAAALEHAFELTPRGTTILFSPACASFDAYPNFRARALELRALLPAPDAPEAAEASSP